MVQLTHTHTHTHTHAHTHTHTNTNKIIRAMLTAVNTTTKVKVYKNIFNTKMIPKLKL